MRVLIEPHLDGTLAPRLRSRVELHLTGCADCRAEVDAARQLGQALHRLPILEFPAHRFATVLVEVQRDERAHAEARRADGLWSRLRQRLAGWSEPGIAGRAWRAALATSAVAVAAVAVLLVLKQQGPARPSQAELAQAEQEALLALAYVIQVTQGSSQDALSVAVADVVDGVSRVENVMGNVGIVVADKTTEHIVPALTYPARLTDRQQPPRPEARVDTTQQEERQ
jgi:anti-sigma factor RsiW